MVSVLMTAYNREKYIAEAIGSVLASTYSAFELIIVDDCSKDGTVEIARSFAARDSRVKVYVNEKNLGDYPNRNRAASYAGGRYLKYLDSDDVLYPHSLQVMVACMEVFPEAALGLCSVPDPQRPYPVCLSPHESYMEHFNGYGHFERAPGSAIITREAFEATGGFTGERMIGDYQLWFMIARTYPVVKMPRDLVWDRLHAGQESNSAYAKAYDKLKKKVLMDALRHPDCPLNEEEKRKISGSSRMARLKKRVTKFSN